VKKSIIALALAAPLFASAQNLLVDGSFESGLNFWSVGGDPLPLYPVAAIAYGPTAAFGEAVPADDAVSSSPDLTGTMAVYFVDDFAMQTLSQTFTVASAGIYQAGFSYYAPANGHANPNDAAFSVVIDGNPLLNTTAGALSVANWAALSQSLALSAGSHTITFAFQASGFPSKDVIVDRAFVTAVPEPETYALMLAGLAGVGFMARRRARRG
jgi:hypothetical protein